MKSNSTAPSQVVEILAINLLKNARLPGTTLTNATMQLISRIEIRAKNEAQNQTKVINLKGTQGVQKVMECLNNMNDPVKLGRC